MKTIFLLLICITFQEYSMKNIDWDFIADREGNITTANVPDPEGSQSGVTIASGFDLGARSVSDLKGLSPSLIETLTPYLGLKKQEALQKLKEKPLKISADEALSINKFAKAQSYNLLANSWKEATGKEFSSLPKHKATIITSVAFQYGNLKKRTPNFWKQVTKDSWDQAYKNLLNFGDNYSSRRKEEAKYFKKGEEKYYKSTLKNQKRTSLSET